MESAFTAKFKLFPNKKRKTGKDCDRYLIIDWTPAEARKAAEWLVKQADAADMPGGSTFRQYTSKTDYEEVPGFAMWGSQWSVNPDSEEEWEDGRGNISARA